jgi:hypothetical protein
MLRQAAERVAAKHGLDADEVLAEARRIAARQAVLTARYGTEEGERRFDAEHAAELGVTVDEYQARARAEWERMQA